MIQSDSGRMNEIVWRPNFGSGSFVYWKILLKITKRLLNSDSKFRLKFMKMYLILSLNLGFRFLESSTRFEKRIWKKKIWSARKIKWLSNEEHKKLKKEKLSSNKIFRQTSKPWIPLESFQVMNCTLRKLQHIWSLETILWLLRIFFKALRVAFEVRILILELLL